MRARKTQGIFMLFTLALVVAGALWYFAPTGISAAIERCGSDESKKQQCYQKLIDQKTRESGVAAGLDMLMELYYADPAFGRYCHGNTHDIGKYAYGKFRENEDFSISAKTSYCGFGFYHGFLEAMLYDKGDLSAATEFCEYIDGKMRGEINGISYACYHGIGHGVVDGTDPALWGDIDAYIRPGLEMCAALPTAVEEHKTRCASGVFNALAIAYLDPRYGLKPNPEDPYDVCRRQDVPYARKACYDQMNGYVNFSTPDFREALLKALGTAEPSYRDLAIETVAGFRVLEAISAEAKKSLAGYITDCSVLDGPYRGLCARGFASALIEHGKPGAEYRAALDACIESSSVRGECLEGIYAGVYDRLPPKLRTQLCTDVEAGAGAEEGARCRTVMSKDPNAS